MIAVIAEPRDGGVHRASLETVAAAAELAGRPLIVVLAGSALDEPIAALAATGIDEIVVLEHGAIRDQGTGHVVGSITNWIQDAGPELVLAAHTYWARDVLPRVAARLCRPLITDCTAIRDEHDGRLFTRPIFRGKLTATVAVDGPPPYLATLQAGAFASQAAPRSTGSTKVTRIPVAMAVDQLSEMPEPAFQESRPSVDLSRADRIVAAGRGVQDSQQLELVRRLAAALGAEVAASRPLCDAGWLPMDRQIGSSGQTVAPRLYVALGISGAIQHIVGMKGAKTIVAINKDPQAPIFEIADYAVIGDLGDVLPALIAALDGDSKTGA